MAEPLRDATPVLKVAVAGNPNAGKTSVFNKLTGLRQKVANYPGVTVEKKTGACHVDGVEFEVIDLPGAYSLTADSPDEMIARDVLFGWQTDTGRPDVVVVVVDATNLERNLFLVTQILELGYPAVLALNMVDVVASRGARIDPRRLSLRLGVPVVETVARSGQGIDRLKTTLLEAVAAPLAVPLDEPLAAEVELIAGGLAARWGVDASMAPAMALRLLTSPSGLEDTAQRFGPEATAAIRSARERILAAGGQWQGGEAAARYRWIKDVVVEASSGRPLAGQVTRTDQIDRILTHRVFGPVIFLCLMALVFQSIYTWAAPFMDLVDVAFTRLADGVRGVLPPGLFADLVADGIITGVGSVVIFLPQIMFLFLFITLLEDTGYMSRAAFIMDRLMSKVGLHGRSFVPLLSSFACAIPGIMSARTISSRRDRLVTILVAPLMTCSARLPVYALLIAAFVPDRRLLGGLLSLQGATLLALYLLGVVGALTVAAVLKRTILRGPTPAMLLELPPYRVPAWDNVLRQLWERAFLFVRFAGTVILSLSIVLWFFAAFPRADVSAAPVEAQQVLADDGNLDPSPEQLAEEVARIEGRLQLEQSLLGRFGHAIEPVVRPLGFDWRIGVGLGAAFAAREVMVSTLGILFAVGDQADETDTTLMTRMRQARGAGGSPLFTPAVVASLLVFFVFACQCLSTVGVVVRETGGWRWARFMVTYMTILAYLASLVTYQSLRLAGWG